ACRWPQWSAACCRRSTKELGSPPATQDGQPGRRLASTSWCPSLSLATAISPPRLRAADQQRSACTAHPVLWTPALAATRCASVAVDGAPGMARGVRAPRPAVPNDQDQATDSFSSHSRASTSSQQRPAVTIPKAGLPAASTPKPQGAPSSERQVD